ncbi:hypothetical protein NQ176_g3563 [Zarea fungicola]|uniref:Uncharacterized protein n=1 Tax=Zarea fungicola TaxID=93591 RepID=A0ACC1NI07_9HYPO|nr:hypothetical protein NQ176_g3563 [Lecanicillium fungicola]
MQTDPDTVKDCVDWYDNDMRQTCAEVRKMLNISPKEFNDWNPSVGLDCSHWYYASYCVLTQSKLNKLTATMTSTTSTTTTTTTSTSTFGPSPTAWKTIGCYSAKRKGGKTVLSHLISDPAGDGSLTLAKCQDSCYRLEYEFVGVMAGNQCWCGSYVARDRANDPKDCNTPCTGDTNLICGGKDFLNVFQASSHELRPISSSSSTTASTVTTAASTTTTVAADSSTTPTASATGKSSSSSITTTPYTSIITVVLILLLA